MYQFYIQGETSIPSPERSLTTVAKLPDFHIERIDIPADAGELYQYTSIEAEIRVNTLQLNTSFINDLHVEYIGPSLHLLIFFGAGALYSTGERQLALRNGHFLFEYRPGPEIAWVLRPEDGYLNYLILDICIPPRLLKTFTQIYYQLAPMMAAVLKNQPYLLTKTYSSVNRHAIVDLIKLIKIRSKVRSGHSLYLESITTSLFISLFEPIFSCTSLSSTDLSSYQVDPKIKRVADILSEHPEEHHTISSLARMADVNCTDLKRGMRRVYGMTMGKYLSERRIRKAIQLIMTTSLSLSNIAEMCGYTNLQALYKVFNKNVGCPPGALRK